MNRIKLSESGTVNKERKKERERMTRRRIKSELYSIKCIQFLRLKIQK